MGVDQVVVLLLVVIVVDAVDTVQAGLLEGLQLILLGVNAIMLQTS